MDVPDSPAIEGNTSSLVYAKMLPSEAQSNAKDIFEAKENEHKITDERDPTAKLQSSTGQVLLRLVSKQSHIMERNAAMEEEDKNAIDNAAEKKFAEKTTEKEGQDKSEDNKGDEP